MAPSGGTALTLSLRDQSGRRVLHATYRNSTLYQTFFFGGRDHIFTNFNTTYTFLIFRVLFISRNGCLSYTLPIYKPSCVKTGRRHRNFSLISLYLYFAWPPQTGDLATLPSALSGVSPSGLQWTGTSW